MVVVITQNLTMLVLPLKAPILVKWVIIVFYINIVSLGIVTSSWTWLSYLTLFYMAIYILLNVTCSDISCKQESFGIVKQRWSIFNNELEQAYAS